MTDNSSFKRIFSSMQSGVQSGISSVQQTIMRQGNSTFYPSSMQNQKSVKNGWLTKKGGVVKSWHRRWFTIKGDYMYYFASDDESKQPLGHIFLPGNKVVENSFNNNEPDRFLFEVVPGRDPKMSATHETYPLCASSHEERRDWIQAIRQVMHAEKGGAIFGQSLVDTLMYERRLENNPMRKIPQIVEGCVDFITKNGLDIEGIFRLPGRNIAVRELREKYDCGERPQLDVPDTDIHSIASLLKSYLRELPEPLIPCKFYETVMKIVMRDMNQDPDKAVQNLGQVLENIPQENYNLLQYLCKFLNEVSSQSDQNKMTIMNLSTVFAQSFIYPEDDDPALLMGTASGRTQAVFVMVTFHETVFKVEYTPQGNSLVIDQLLDLGSKTTSTSHAELVQSNSYESDLAGLNLFGDCSTVSEPLAPSDPPANEDSPAPIPPVRPNRKAPKVPPRPSSPPNTTLFKDNSEDSASEKLYPLLPVDDVEITAENFDDKDTSQTVETTEQGPTVDVSEVWRNRQGSIKGHRRAYILEVENPEVAEDTFEDARSTSISSLPRDNEPLSKESGIENASAPKIPPRPKVTSVPSESSINGTLDDLDIKEDTLDSLISMDLSGSSADELHAHIQVLNTKLLSLRTKLLDTNAKVAAMDLKHKEQFNSMAKLLDTEKNATANAVDRIMMLNKELEGYSMKYGPLQ